MMVISSDELLEVIEGLDALNYWQLSDSEYRNNGYVEEPGSNDPETAARIARVNDLFERFEKFRDETLKLALRGPFIVKLEAMPTHPVPVHAVDCDMDEDCTCGAQHGS